MGSLNIPGCCQKKGRTYRRLRYYDADGRRKDRYIPLPDPSDPRFAVELARVNAAISEPAAVRSGPLPGSFGALVTDFRAALAQGWTKKRRKKGAAPLAANTLANYSRYLAMIEDGSQLFTNRKTGTTTPLRDLDVTGLRTAHVYQLRDAMADTPGKANNWLNVFKLLLTFAAQRDWRSDNPAAAISPLPLGEHEPWPADVLADVLAHAPDMLRLAIVTGLCAGQRISDCIKIQHGWMKGGILTLDQTKTAVGIAIPVHPWWQEEIDRLPRSAVTILYDRYGRPFRTEEAIQARLRTLMHARGHVDDDGQLLYTFHGLRKNAACYLIEVLQDDAAVGRLLGMTPDTLRHYTKRVSAYRIAETVAAKVTGIDRNQMGR